MTQRAELADGTVLEFPDDTPDDVINRVVKEHVAASRPDSPAADVTKSFGSGIVRGAAETLMLPVTAKRLGEQAVGYGLEGGEDLLRSIFGLSPADPAARAEARTWAAGNPVDRAVYGAQDAARGLMDRTLHAPQTTPGEYAETIGEFAVPGGVPSKGVRLAPGIARKGADYASELMRKTVVPAVMSEGAGQLTEGTAYEPYARVAGGVVGGLGGAVVQTYSAPETVVRRALGNPQAVDWEKAIALQDAKTGIRLTGPEAISQAQGGASALPNIQRMVEGATEGRAITAPFFAERPAQVERAVGTVLDKIAPQSPAPSTLGPRVSAAAERAIQASPEGQALVDAIFGAGPRVTPMQAGEVVQPAMRGVFDRREGMRNALGDKDFAAARAAPPTIPVDELTPRNTVRAPGYTRLDPAENAITGMPEMQPSAVPPRIETPGLASNTGPDFIQVDARPALRAIDQLRSVERGPAAAALDRARSMLFRDGNVDTSVVGLENARDGINGMIDEAQRAGNKHVVEQLTRAREALDASLATSPTFAAANRNFAAASEPLRPFEQPGLKAVVQKDQFGRDFTLPPEQVPAALSTPSEARNFAAVAPDDAFRTMGSRIATDLLDGASDASGRVNGERLGQLMRENEDLLSAYPDVAERLQRVVAAAAGMASARTGALGGLAKGNGTTDAANLILPPNPLSGSQDETTQTVIRLLQQDEGATRGLMRQNLSDRFQRAMTETQEGNREFGGAKFHKDVAGNPQRRTTLDAAVGALPDQTIAPDMADVLEALQATGRRKPIGSTSAFNDMTKGDLGEASLFGRTVNTAKTLGASFITQAGDATKRAALRQSIASLADMFTDPRSVELIRSVAAGSPPTIFGDAILRALAQANVTANSPEARATRGDGR